MNATKKELTKQFERAQRLGWLPAFAEAVKTHTTGHFDEADLLGIASRETNLDPKWLTKAGDRGNGYGLMQADVRSFPEWIKSGKWRDAREGILMGAKVLMMKWTDVQKCIGKDSTVWSNKAKKYFHFIGKKVEGAEAQTVTIAAYNGGRWAHYAVSKGQHADEYTTGGDYASDVQERAAYFRPLFADWKNTNLRPDEDNPLLDDSASAQNTDVANTQVADTGDNPTPDASNAKLKDFSDKYLKHCPQDKLKNIAAVAGARILGGAVTLWGIGLHGQILLVALGIVILAALGYTVYKYWCRIVGWAKTIADSFLGN